MNTPSWALALTLLMCMTSANAGRSCEPRAPEVAGVERSLALAAATEDALNASGARVVVLARAGQDLSAHGLRWSHLGWAYRLGPGSGEAEGSWRVVHKLNHCGAADAALYRQGLAEFFLDDPFEYRATFAVPTESVQAQLLELLQDNPKAGRLHVSAYNLVAYPWSTRYQQSNQWAIETLAAAADSRVASREQAQAWLQLNGYAPTTLRLGTFTRLGARLTAANVAFDDHPDEQRYAGRIQTVTVDSVLAWLQRRALAGPAQEVR